MNNRNGFFGFILLNLTFVTGVITSISLMAPSVADALTHTCTWTGASTSHFNVAANWTNCNSSTPASGDNIVFDNTTIPSTGSILYDDLSGITFGNVTFSGTGTNAYDITSTSANTLNVGGNITDSTSSGGAQIDMPITLSGGTNTISTTTALKFGDSITPYTLNIGTDSVTFSGNGQVSNYENITGSGSINTSANQFIQWVTNPSFTGALAITAGDVTIDSISTTLPDMFGASSGINISSGATFTVYDLFVTNGTLVEPFTTAGTGVNTCSTLLSNGTQVNCGAIFANLNTSSNLTLSGTIVLSGESQFNSNNTITLTGPLSGSHKVTNAVGTLVVSSSGNTSGTANGTYSAAQNLVTGGGTTTPAASTTTTAAAAPKTPNTGLGFIKVHTWMPLLGSIMMGSGIYFLARKVKHPIKIVKH